MSESSINNDRSIADLYMHFKQQQNFDDLSEEELCIQIAIHQVKADFHYHEIKRIKDALTSRKSKQNIGRPKKWDDNFLSDFDKLVQQVMVAKNIDQRSAITHIYVKVYCLSKYPNHSSNEIEDLIYEGECDMKLMIDSGTEEEFSRLSNSEVFELSELKQWSGWIHTIENQLGAYRNRVKQNKKD